MTRYPDGPALAAAMRQARREGPVRVIDGIPSRRYLALLHQPCTKCGMNQGIFPQPGGATIYCAACHGQLQGKRPHDPVGLPARVMVRSGLPRQFAAWPGGEGWVLDPGRYEVRGGHSGETAVRAVPEGGGDGSPTDKWALLGTVRVRPQHLATAEGIRDAVMRVWRLAGK